MAEKVYINHVDTEAEFVMKAGSVKFERGIARVANEAHQAAIEALPAFARGGIAEVPAGESPVLAPAVGAQTVVGQRGTKPKAKPAEGAEG